MTVIRFRALFGVRREHALDAVFSASRAAGPWRERWIHEEHDGTGRLLARYESWVRPAERETAQLLDWRKLTPAGETCAECQPMTIPSNCDFDS